MLCGITVFSAGVVVGLVGLIAWFAVQHAKRSLAENQSETCEKHMVQLRNAVLSYASEHGDKFPASQGWCDSLSPYVTDRSVFVCPGGRNKTCSYAMNAAVGGLKTTDPTNASDLVLLFESDAGWNAAGGSDLLPEAPRHFGGDHVFFVDGSGGYQPRRYRDAGTVRHWLKDYSGTVEWTPHLRSH